VRQRRRLQVRCACGALAGTQGAAAMHTMLLLLLLLRVRRRQLVAEVCLQLICSSQELLSIHLNLAALGVAGSAVHAEPQGDERASRVV
jgi:hypothetical protein